MQRKHFGFRFAFLTFAAGWLWAAGPNSAVAEPLWAKLVPGKRVEADPNKDYVMTELNGPWMIVATTFSGDGAEDHARELVLELRSRYKVEAYTHQKTFDFTGGVEGRGVDRTGQPMQMRYRRAKEIHEYAVLVGNYPRVDDSEAARTLEKIKFMRPATLDPEKRKKSNQNLASLRRIQTMLLPDGDENKHKGPMGKAFITRNPMLPKEYFASSAIDDLVLKMNADVKFSLLRCPGKYTVKVGTFTGRIVLDQREVQAYEQGLKDINRDSRLLKAAEDAETLTMALRNKGYEAYSFHDRYSSIVTVGSFDSVGTPRADGKIEINPQIHEIMQRFSAAPNTASDGIPDDQGSHKLKSLLKIPFDIQPQIVNVPQPELSRSVGQQVRQ